MTVSLPPGLLMIGGGLLLPWLPRRLYRGCCLLLPIVALCLTWLLDDGSRLSLPIAGLQLELLHLSAMGRLFASAFLIATGAGALFAVGSARRLELAAAFVYAGGAVSITHCGDWISLFMMWELMAIASTLIVWCGAGKQARQAGMRYLLVHLAGGVVLMSGIAGHLVCGGDSSLSQLTGDSLWRWLILGGLLINAGAPPFSFWVADAYPAASASGMIFLSALTTKTAVFTLLSCFCGEALLIPIGGYMALYGIIYALRENNMRRILAYSLVNQVGFMVIAVGIGTTTAVNAATLHAMAHILYKTVLVMGAGAVLRSTGRHRCSDLGQLAQQMPWVTVCVVIGAAASMGLPLTSSFVTKSLILQAAAEQQLTTLWIFLLACSAAVVFNAGVRFPWLVFFRARRTGDMPAADLQGLPRWSLVLCAALCLALGCFPQLIYERLPYPAHYHPYTLLHVIEQLQLLVPASLLFFICLPVLTPRQQIQLDWDWLLRRLMRLSWDDGILRLVSIALHLRDLIISSAVRGFMFLFRHHGPRGILARSWPTGSIALWVALILASYVVLYSLQSRSVWEFMHHSLH